MEILKVIIVFSTYLLPLVQVVHFKYMYVSLCWVIVYDEHWHKWVKSSDTHLALNSEIFHILSMYLTTSVVD